MKIKKQVLLGWYTNAGIESMVRYGIEGFL
jgi:hypothetical protein